MYATLCLDSRTGIALTLLPFLAKQSSCLSNLDVEHAEHIPVEPSIHVHNVDLVSLLARLSKARFEYRPSAITTAVEVAQAPIGVEQVALMSARTIMGSRDGKRSFPASVKASSNQPSPPVPRWTGSRLTAHLTAITLRTPR